MSDELGNAFQIAIRRIKLISIILDESLFVTEPNKLVNIQFQYKVNIKDGNKDLFAFTLKTIYQTENNPDQFTLQAEVENVFEIKNLQNYLSPTNNVTFPQEVWATIVGLSFSHSRALISQHIISTPLQNSLIPIINPVEAARTFFPDNALALERDGK